MDPAHPASLALTPIAPGGVKATISLYSPAVPVYPEDGRASWSHSLHPGASPCLPPPNSPGTPRHQKPPPNGSTSNRPGPSRPRSRPPHRAPWPEPPDPETRPRPHRPARLAIPRSVDLYPAGVCPRSTGCSIPSLWAETNGRWRRGLAVYLLVGVEKFLRRIAAEQCRDGPRRPLHWFYENKNIQNPRSPEVNHEQISRR